MQTLPTPYCHLDLRGLAGDIPRCIRGPGKRGRRCEEGDCNAALVSKFLGSRKRTRHIHTHHFRVPVSHCGTFLLIDNAVYNLVAHDTDSTGNTGPADGSVLYQVVGLDFEDHCEGVVLPLLVSLAAGARAATLAPCFGPCLGTVHFRHHRSGLDLANPHYIRRFHSVAPYSLDIPVEPHVENCH